MSNVEISGLKSAYKHAKQCSYGANMSISAALVVDMAKRIAELEKSLIAPTGWVYVKEEDINRMVAYITELEKENGWTSVDEEWPNPEKGNVLGHNGNYAFECSWDDGWWCNIGGEEFTYWKPLNPPKEQVK